MDPSDSLSDIAFGATRKSIFSSEYIADSEILQHLQSRVHVIAATLIKLRKGKQHLIEPCQENFEVKEITERLIADDVITDMEIENHDSIWQALARQTTGRSDTDEDLRTGMLFALATFKRDYEHPDAFGGTLWKSLFRTTRTSLDFNASMYRVFCQTFAANVVVIFVRATATEIKRFTIGNAARTMYVVLYTRQVYEKQTTVSIYALIPKTDQGDINDDAFVELSQEPVDLFSLDERLEKLAAEGRAVQGPMLDAISANPTPKSARSNVSNDDELLVPNAGGSDLEHPKKRVRYLNEPTAVVVLDRGQDLLCSVHKCFRNAKPSYVVFKLHTTNYLFKGQERDDFEFLNDSAACIQLKRKLLCTVMVSKSCMTFALKEAGMGRKMTPLQENDSRESLLR